MDVLARQLASDYSRFNAREGLLVEPRDPVRLAVALQAIWADDRVHDGVAAAARGRAESDRRSRMGGGSDRRYAPFVSSDPARRVSAPPVR